MLSRPQLLQILGVIQNRARYAHQDIMTFSGFMSLEELPAYVWQQFASLDADDKARVLKIARGLVGEAV